jgi:PIN domain nuclease of toxin-antitoxin system
VNPAEEPDAEWAAARWHRGEGLSLADRFCLALGQRLGLPALTADTAWGNSDSVRQIR